MLGYSIANNARITVWLDDIEVQLMNVRYDRWLEHDIDVAMESVKELDIDKHVHHK